MEKALVFICEDDKGLCRTMTTMLRLEEHQVVLVANSLAEALEKVKSAEEKRINVAILDGNLGTGKEDGRQVAKALREAVPGIKIISFSGDPADWGDKNPRKPYDMRNLNQIIAETLEGR